MILGLCYDIALFFSLNSKIESENISDFYEIISIRQETSYKNKYIIKSKMKKYILYAKKKEVFFPGDMVYVEGVVEKGDVSRNYKGFNYRRYLYSKKIYGIINVDYIEKKGVKKDFHYYCGIFKNRIYKKIDKMYERKEQSFLKGILFGDDNLEEEIIENFRECNISHILAISGLHIGIIVLFFGKLIEKIPINKKTKYFLQIIFLMFFLFFIGMPVSAMRACIMVSLVFISKMIDRKNNFYISMAFSFFVVIIINPYNIYNIGMWLSYMGTVGIVIFSKFINRFISIKISFKNKIIKYIIDAFSISISAQIMIFPIMVYSFNTVSFSFFIPNIIVSIFIVPIVVIRIHKHYTSFYFIC